MIIIIKNNNNNNNNDNNNNNNNNNDKIFFVEVITTFKGRARIVYKGLYNWPNETIGKQHKQCP